MAPNELSKFNPLDHPIIFSYPNRLIKSSAWIQHIPFAFYLIEVLRPKVVVELGTHTGVSYSAFCQAIKELNLNTKAYAIDSWTGDEQTGFYGNEIFEDFQDFNSRNYESFSTLIRSRFDDSVQEFEDGTIDLLHIDGCHKYEQVKHDFETWKSKVSERGVVVFHDTDVFRDEFGVWKLWEEISHQYPSFKFKHGNGLGILLIGNKIPKEFLEFVNAAGKSAGIQALFNIMGEKLEKDLIVWSQKSLILEKDALLSEKEDLCLYQKEEISENKLKTNELIQQNIAINIRSQMEMIPLEKQLQDLYESETWKVGSLFTRPFQILFPINSKRRKIIWSIGSLLSAQSKIRGNQQKQITDSKLYLDQEKPDAQKIIPDQAKKDILNKDLINEIYQSETWKIGTFFIRPLAKLLPPMNPFRQKSAKLFNSADRLNNGKRKYIKDDSGDIENKMTESEIKSWDSPPLISILVPIYRTPKKILSKMIESVISQISPNWELVLVNASTENAEINETLTEYALRDNRIKVINIENNLGISNNTNIAFEHSSGNYLAFLDHDDLLDPYAVYYGTKYIIENPNIDIVYSDEDKIDSDGNVLNESFYKPDWSPIYLLSKMYVGHFLIVKRAIYQKLCGLNSEFDGVQDFEFVLRAAELNPVAVHIPKILYYWRKVQGSIAMDIDEKGTQIEDLQVKAVKNHLNRLGINCIVHKHPVFRHCVQVEPSQDNNNYPLVSIIILSKDNPELIHKCLESVFTISTYPNYEVIVVDNNSSNPDTFEEYKKYPIKVIEFNSKFNYSKANNIGFNHSSGEYVILLNNDIEVLTKDWIEQLLFYCKFPSVGAVGPLLLYPNRTVQHAGIVLGFRGTADHVMRYYPNGADGYAGSLSCAHEVSAVTGACMMVKRSDYKNSEGLLEDYQTHYQDVDFCLRLRAQNKVNIFVPNSVLVHHESITRGKYYDHIDRELLLDLRGEMISKGDPYYNPNFQLTDNTRFYVKE